MKTVTPFDPDTGLFGAVLTVPDRALASMPSFKDGRFDKRTQRVEIATGDVIHYEQPASEVEAVASVTRSHAARRRIADLERAQNRAVRELALAPDNADARKRLQDIDDEIAAKRGDL